MNKQQLVDAVGERLGDRRTAATAVEAVLDTVTGALADGERVAIFGFGVFERVDRAARTARNPATGGTVDVPATAVPRFRPGQGLKDAVSGRSSRADRSTAATRSADEPRTATAAPPEPRTSPAKAKAKAGKGAGKGVEAKAGKGTDDEKAKGKKSKGKGKGKGKG